MNGERELAPEEERLRRELAKKLLIAIALAVTALVSIVLVLFRMSPYPALAIGAIVAISLLFLK
ncbi:MAG: hypothetical protein M0Z59_00855 [Nitrospiraceae bacterium]|nr:hypothetical protein [Nitrospiraceae bacterium]